MKAEYRAAIVNIILIVVLLAVYEKIADLVVSFSFVEEVWGNTVYMIAGVLCIETFKQLFVKASS